MSCLIQTWNVIDLQTFFHSSDQFPQMWNGQIQIKSTLHTPTYILSLTIKSIRIHFHFLTYFINKSKKIFILWFTRNDGMRWPSYGSYLKYWSKKTVLVNLKQTVQLLKGSVLIKGNTSMDSIHLSLESVVKN